MAMSNLSAGLFILKVLSSFMQSSPAVLAPVLPTGPSAMSFTSNPLHTFVLVTRAPLLATLHHPQPGHCPDGYIVLSAN